MSTGALGSVGTYAYAQVLGLGLLWTSVHCAGMCGPLLSGLDVPGHGPGRGAGRLGAAARGVGGVLLYQAGKALTYAWLGGLCGLLGAGVRRVFAPAGSVLALGLGTLALGLALRPLLAGPRLSTLRGPAPAGILDRLGQLGRGLLLPLLTSQHPGRNLLLGAMLGFLPCMIPLWALGLAALTGSALHGAAVMLLLVAVTTPVLLGVTLVPPLLCRGRLGRRLPQILLGVSGAWLVLVGGAGLGLWSHAHVGFRLLGAPLMMMFF